MPSVFSALAESTGDKKRWNQVGLALHGLLPAGDIQQSIFEDLAASITDERLQAALDDIQTRFGRDSVTRGGALSVKSGTLRELNFPMA